MAKPRIDEEMIALLPRMRRFAMLLAADRDDADDLVQATCERALKSLHLFTPDSRLDSWMYKIMQNLWIDSSRKRNREGRTQDLETASDRVAEDGRRTTEGRLTMEAVRQAITALPEDHRAVLVLACIEQLSYRETAEILDIPVGTVMSRLARARGALVETLGLTRSEIISPTRYGDVL